MKTIVASAIIALSVLMQNAAAETGNAPFCLQTPTGAKCVYDTMGECERARGNTSAVQCITQSDAHGITGLGDPVPVPMVPMSPSR
jgi:hypothetical protein